MIVDVLGMGLSPKNLPQYLVESILDADVLVGGKRQLEFFSDAKGEKLEIVSPLEDVINSIREHSEQGRRVMVLADGDPLFYGIGKRMCKELGAKNVRIQPGVTTLQTAAARLGIAWHDINIVSLHGRDNLVPLFAALTWQDRVAVFTDENNTPATIAREMLARGATSFGMWVFENLESDIESVGKYNLRHAVNESFSKLNFVVLERTKRPEIALRLGIPDDDFKHEKGLITKAPVRAVGLATLAITDDSVIWDLGAGSGSVAIEAAALARKGAVYAVEQDGTRVKDIDANIKRSGAYSVKAIHGVLPGCLPDLPTPDRIFIGGGLGDESAVLDAACERLKPGGRLTAHLVLLDSLNSTKAYLSNRGWPVDITQVQCSRSKALGSDVHMEGLNPVFIVSTQKPS